MEGTLIGEAKDTGASAEGDRREGEQVQGKETGNAMETAVGPGLGEGLSVYTLCPKRQKHVELISKISFKRVGN